MNTTAEKKRILSMPTVQGELKINGRTYKFGCIKEENNGVDRCVMLRRAESVYAGEEVHILPHHADLEIWAPGFAGGYLSQFVKYSDIKILWCTYQGIPLTQKAELQQAA